MFFSRIRLKPEFYKATHLAKVLSDNTYNIHRLLWDLFPEEKQRNFLYREEIAREQLVTQASIHGEPIYYVVSSTRPSSTNPIFQVDEREYHPKIRQGDRLHFELRANPVIQKAGEKHDVVMDAQLTFLKSLCAEFNLYSLLPSNPKKREFKKVLLAQGGRALDIRLTALLKDNYIYAERLNQTMQLSDKLDWSLKSNIDDALENWLCRKGAQLHGFSLKMDKYGQFKLQNSAYRWQTIKADKKMKSGFSSVDFTGALEITDVDKFLETLFKGIGRAKAFGCGLLLIRRI
ncbi:MAG: type I-E CRISPR-associated protein Cas6/Cse3/CasE [Desulfobacteraceae bacterium]|nr:MAG: type I-E CRISPR-associated protein Cas6/Cse3/CasE [Desulfobacteraceae bacterium]